MRRFILLLGVSLTSCTCGPWSHSAHSIAPGLAQRCESELITQAAASLNRHRQFSLTLRGPGNTELDYVGVRHTFDSTDVQFPTIEAAWKNLLPTVAFFEGTDTVVGATLNGSIARAGEPGLVRFLAARDGIPAHSLEPTREDEVRELLHRFTAEQLVIFYGTRPLAEMRERRHPSQAALDSLISRSLAYIQTIPALAGSIPDEAAYRAQFARFFPGVDPTAAPSDWFDPLRRSAETGSVFLNDVNEASSAFRDLYMYRTLVAAAKPGARIFAEVGRDHIPAQAQALRCAFGS